MLVPFCPTPCVLRVVHFFSCTTWRIVGHTAELRKNGRTNQDFVWGGSCQSWDGLVEPGTFYAGFTWD